MCTGLSEREGGEGSNEMGGGLNFEVERGGKAKVRGGGRACGVKSEKSPKMCRILAKNRIFGEFRTFSAIFCAFFSENAHFSISFC